MAPLIAGSVLSTPETITAAISAYADVGVDEINFWPTSAGIEQLRRLADAIG